MEYILIIILGAAVVFAVMKVKKQRQQKSRQKMLSDELARLKQMNVDLDVEGYIREEKRAMAYPENREILTTMQMNLVAAYINNAQAEEAVSCLKQMDPSVLPLDFQILYHHNMLFAKWMQDEHAFGQQLAESWPLLEKHVDEAQWKPILKIIQVLNDLYTKNYDAAQQHIRHQTAIMRLHCRICSGLKLIFRPGKRERLWHCLIKWLSVRISQSSQHGSNRSE